MSQRGKQLFTPLYVGELLRGEVVPFQASDARANVANDGLSNYSVDQLLRAEVIHYRFGCMSQRGKQLLIPL